MSLQKKDNQKLSLLTSAQTLTGSYADLGNVDGGPFINVMDTDSVTLWVKLDINSSTGIKIKMLSKESETATDLYESVIKNISATAVAVSPQEVTITNNADQNIMVSFNIGDQLPLVKFQVMATVVGGTAGQILDAGVTFTSQI